MIVDLPDPDTPVLGRLYSTEFYALISRALAPGGLLVVQTGSPYSTANGVLARGQHDRLGGLRRHAVPRVRADIR